MSKPSSDGVLSVNRGERIGKFPGRLFGSTVGIDRAADAADTGQTHARPGLLKRRKLGEHSGQRQRLHLVGGDFGAALRGLGGQIAEAEIIHILRTQVDGVRNRIVPLVLKIKFSTMDKILGVIRPAVLIMGPGVAEEDRAQPAQALIAAIGLLVGV